MQICKAAMRARADGFERLIFGEPADVVYGGFDGLLSKDWLVGDFIDRFTFVPPWKALRHPQLVVEPILAYERDGHLDPHSFVSDCFLRNVITSYQNACATAGCELVVPFFGTYLAAPIDYARIRGGENKYLVREVFKTLYPDCVAPKKLPMPRATNEWFRDCLLYTSSARSRPSISGRSTTSLQSPSKTARAARNFPSSTARPRPTASPTSATSKPAPSKTSFPAIRP